MTEKHEGLTPENLALYRETWRLSMFPRQGYWPELNRLIEAVRREERERAIAVLWPLVECVSMNVRPSPTEINRASSYITQAEGGET